MAKKVYKVTLSDGSTHVLAADSEQEARTLARQYYTHNIKSTRQVQQTRTAFRDK